MTAWDDISRSRGSNQKHLKCPVFIISEEPLYPFREYRRLNDDHG